MKVTKPSKLTLGDTIGIVASSLPVLPSFRKNYERGKTLIEEMGFKIKEGKTISKTYGWAAGTPKEVAEDINSMFADKSVKAIMAQTGGYSAVSVLEHLDCGLIAKNPKPYIGMSDVTNFHLTLFSKIGLVGFHMDDVTFGFGQDESGLDKEFFLRFLTQTKAPGIIKPLSEWEVWKKGKAEGHLMGGNLYVMQGLIGTEYFPPVESFKNSIFYFEEVGGMKVDLIRRLYQLKYLGVFDRTSGLLIGKLKYIKPMREEEIKEPSLKEAILEVLKDYKFPIMANLDFGHFTVNIPMPIGIKVSFDTEKKELNFLESAVS